VYYKHGRSPDPEILLCLHAILAAAKDATIDVTDIDGFVGYAGERNHAVRLANALGVRELRWSTMQWGGGGGGGAGAVQQAAAAIASGFSECVLVYRALAQGEAGRFGLRLTASPETRDLLLPYGVVGPIHKYAPRVMRFLHETGVGRETLKAVAMASYYHAQRNPRAVMAGKPLDAETYEQARWITEPFRLYDCCQENDGAAAMLLVSADRAREMRADPVYVLGAAQGNDHRADGTESMILHNSPDYATANFRTLAPRLYAMAELEPSDVDVVQAYENFTGGTVMALLEHGFCSSADADRVLTFENLIAPDGGLPLNTSGGNLAEAYVHGMEQHIEAVRQLRGESANQVPDARVGLVAGGPMVTPVSTVLYGTQETL
jgi:acetyl-CoA acetyltransferase